MIGINPKSPGGDGSTNGCLFRITCAFRGSPARPRNLHSYDWKSLGASGSASSRGWPASLDREAVWPPRAEGVPGHRRGERRPPSGRKLVQSRSLSGNKRGRSTRSSERYRQDSPHPSKYLAEWSKIQILWVQYITVRCWVVGRHNGMGRVIK